MVSNGHVTLDGLFFDHFLFSPFSVIVGSVRAKEYIRPHKFDDVVRHVVVKGDLFELMGCGCTKNCIVLCELHQDWIQFFEMYKTRMPHANVTKKVQWE